MTLLITVVSCDEHRDFPDTAMKPCHVLCTDGKVTTYETCKELGKTPIAVVFNINQSEKMEGTGYAVFLHDHLCRHYSIRWECKHLQDVYDKRCGITIGRIRLFRMDLWPKCIYPFGGSDAPTL